MVQPSPIFQMSPQPGFPPALGGLIQSTEIPFAGSGQQAGQASPFGPMSQGQQASPFGQQAFGQQQQAGQFQQQQGGMDAASMLGTMSAMVGMLTQIVSVLFMAVMQKLQSQQMSGGAGAFGQNSAVAEAAGLTPDDGHNHGGGGGGNTVRNGSDIVTVNPGAAQQRSGNGSGNPNIIFEGDSLSVDAGGSYTNQLIKRLADQGIDAHSEATGGDQLRTNVDGDVDGINAQFDPNASDNVVVLWAGTNDLHGGANGEELYNKYKEVAQRYKDKGFKVVVMTSIQLGDGSKGGDQEKDVERKKFNDLIRQQGGPWDSLVDVGAMPEFSDDPNADNVTNSDLYGGDTVHLSGKGYGLIADQVEMAIKQLLGR